MKSYSRRVIHEELFKNTSVVDIVQSDDSVIKLSINRGSLLIRFPGYHNRFNEKYLHLGQWTGADKFDYTSLRPRAFNTHPSCLDISCNRHCIRPSITQWTADFSQVSTAFPGASAQ